MLELLGLAALVFIIGALAIGLLKLLVWLVLLPLKLGFWLLKGLIGLTIVVPLLILGVGVASAFVPLLLVFLLPVLIIVGLVTAAVRCVF
jgi:hypothetical protein